MPLKRVVLVAGARPNFMKIAPLFREFKKNNVDTIVVNTGQHFSADMNDNFLQEFDIKVDYHLEPRHDSVSQQIADIILGLEECLSGLAIDIMIVVGDVNSTLAAALYANKTNIKLAHVEAGLRSFNHKMPEEINRLLTDNLADYLLVPSADALANIRKENLYGKAFMVGNIMIDNLVYFLSQIKSTQEKYYFCTLHRAENVDDKNIFSDILDALEKISQDAKIYLPLHPRTKKMAENFGFLGRLEKIFTILPVLNYQQSLFYQKNAQLILTDSGGLQEEATFLNVPCLTLRTETERPVTVDLGTNIIAGVKTDGILSAYQKMSLNKKTSQKIEMWDGRTAERIFKILNENV